MRPVFAGPRARLHFSNRWGAVSAHLCDVMVGRGVGEASVDVLSATRALFDGETMIDIPPGGSVTSDALDFDVLAGSDLVVTFFVAGTSGPAAGHASTGPSHGTLFLAAGNHAADSSGVDFGTPSIGTSFLVGLDVFVANEGVIVALGDSITEGASSERAYSEILAERLRARDATPRLSVVNAGIGGDAISQLLPHRINDDVLGVTGVIGVVLMVGINDLGGGRGSLDPASPEFVITGIEDAVAQMERAGLVVWLSPLPPCGDADRPSLYVPHYSDPERIKRRHAINEWIRQSRWYDARVDFDEALVDPEHPEWIRADWSADNLHPGTAGQEAMAASVDLRVFDTAVGRARPGGNPAL